MKEAFRDIQVIERMITEEAREKIVATLRATHTDLDYRREPKIEWRRGAIYFHSLQDTLFAARVASPNDFNLIRSVQACFVKDLDDYIERFLPDEDPEMKRFFQAVFRVDTSVFWDQDRAFIEAFDRTYWDLNGKVIRPWAQAIR